MQGNSRIIGPPRELELQVNAMRREDCLCLPVWSQYGYRGNGPLFGAYRVFCMPLPQDDDSGTKQQPPEFYERAA